MPGQPDHYSQLPGQPGAEGETRLRVSLLCAAVLRVSGAEYHMRHGSRALHGHLLPVHLPPLRHRQALCAKVPLLHLHQPHFLLLPPDDGHGHEQAADVQHLVLHRLEDAGARGCRLLHPVRHRQPAAHPGHHRAEPGGVRSAAADAAEDGAATRHQRQRAAEVEGSVLGRRDADDDGAGDDLRGGPGLFSPLSG